MNHDEPIKNHNTPLGVIPAQAGIQRNQSVLDSRLRGSDELGDFLRLHQPLENVDFIKA